MTSEHAGNRNQLAEPRLWWVNQGKTYQLEREGGYVWAPKITKSGVSVAYLLLSLLTACAGVRELENGSGIAASNLSPTQVQSLALLGKVWGFLKYHDPRVTGGDRNWDHELFRIVPRVLAATERAETQEELAQWVASLGEPASCDPCAKDPADATLKPRLDWLFDTDLLGSNLAARLRRVHTNRDADGKQFYVALAPGVNNPIFDNESDYATLAQPDAGFQLLALFRLWSIIEYWFPYRDVMEEDWDQVLINFIPQVFSAATKDDYELALIALMARVHDGHANLWQSLAVRPPRGENRVAVTVRFVEDRAVVTGYEDPERGKATGLERGDVILALDGTPVESLVDRWRPWYAASNESARRDSIALALTKGPPGSVKLTIDRAGRVFDIQAERFPFDKRARPPGVFHDHPGEPLRRLSDDLAYLTLSSVKTGDAEEYVLGAAGARCLVIDIRNYPAEFMVFALGQHLVSQRTEFARFTSGDLSNPGAFHWTEPVALEPRSPHFEGRVAILVDEVSKSQAEYTAMAFRSAPGALVVGSTTAGADGNVSRIPLPGRLRGMMSGIGVFYPNKKPTQRIGIVPDLEVRPTIAGIREGRDEVLEAAVKAVLGREMTDDERMRLGAIVDAGSFAATAEHEAAE